MSVFVYIISAMITNPAQTRPVDDSPRVGAENIGEVKIIANDNANGVLQLSSNQVYVMEGQSQSVINVTRSAGTFGTKVINDADQRVAERSGYIFTGGQITGVLWLGHLMRQRYHTASPMIRMETLGFGFIKVDCNWSRKKEKARLSLSVIRSGVTIGSSGLV
eukprot:XP_011661057.1 PREDICTED: uncharacterized protein LOC105436792 [Strongylocentrotus purpuratus]